VHVNYGIWGWVGASNNPAQGLHTLKSGPGHPSAYLSQAGIVSKRLDEWSCFWHGGFIPSIPHCVVRKFGRPQKLGYFPLELCPELQTQENFATASRSRCQQHSSSSSSTVELVDDTHTTVDESWLLSASRSTVTL